MATGTIGAVQNGSDTRETVKCPICLESYTEPRKMPKCGHLFCEECIVTYVGNQKDNLETENGVACPFCRATNPGPKNKCEIRAWCESLEVAGNRHENGEKKNTGNKNNCDSCSVFGISTKATKVCNNCVELLCVSCSMGRHSLRSCRNHKIINLEVDTKGNLKGTDLKTLKTLREYSCCSKHPDLELAYISEKDDHLYCSKCLITNQCQGIKELMGNGLEEKAESECQALKQSISELSIYAKSIVEAKTMNMVESKNAVEDVARVLQDVRTKIIKLLDTLEETVSEQARAILKNIEISSENDKVTLNDILKSLDDASCLIDNALIYGTTSQVYATLDKTKEAFRKCEISICAMADAIEHESPELAVEDPLENIIKLGLNETNSLAKVNIKRKEITLPYYREMNSLQNSTVIKTGVKSVKQNCSARYPPTYSYLMFLPNDEAVLNDTLNGYCNFTDNAYDVIGYRKVKQIRSCSYTKDGKIAVNCSKSERKIYFLGNDKKLEITSELTTEKVPYAIQALSSGEIAVGWTDPVAFGIISSDVSTAERVYFTKDRSGRELKTFEYIAVDECRKHVMQPCTKDNALYCFDFDGKPKFEYRSSDLSGPRGVALDRNGYIFLCSYENSVIHVISPMGKPIKLIKEGCPNKPLCIAFKSCGDEFAVTRGYVTGEDDSVVTFFKIKRE